MECASGLIKLKPDSQRKVEEWRSTIASRLDEAAATLKDEDVHVESWFTLELSGEKYLLWYLRAKSIKRVFEVSQKLKHPIEQISLRPNGGNHRGERQRRPSHRHTEGLAVPSIGFSKAAVHEYGLWVGSTRRLSAEAG